MSTPDNTFLDYKTTSQKMTTHAKNALSEAFRIAKKAQVSEITDLHLFFAIYLETGSLGSNILKEFGIEDKHFKNFPELGAPKNSASRNITPILSPLLKSILVKAYAIAKNFGYPYVGTEHLVYAILEKPEKSIREILTTVGWKKNHPPIQLINDPAILDIVKMLDFPVLTMKKSEQKNNPNLAKYCVDLNEKTKKRKEVIIGRESELKRIINILGRKNKNNPLLIGPPGIGKTAIISQLAHLINTDAIPPFLLGKKIFNLDVAALIAGTGFRGEFESRLKNILNEIANDKNIILFIDEIHNIIGAGNISGSLDLANILKPALSSGEIQIIGATTQSEHKRHFEKDSALDRRFQPIHINEPNTAETKTILSGIKTQYENFHNVMISEKIIDLIVELSDHYLKDRFFPDKAIDVLDEAAANLRAKNELSLNAKKIRTLEKKLNELFWQKEALLSEQNFQKALELKDQEDLLKEQIKKFKTNKEVEKKRPLTEDDITETVAHISHIPKSKLAQEKNSKIENVKNILSNKIIGQDEAVEKISSVLIRSQFGLGSFDRPLGSFLFLGPSGTGKTLTAQILAQEFFGSSANGRQALIRIDMSEFMERHSISGLIGSPAGYIGFGEGGRLTEKVRRQPHSVVLFDEIEKAHPDVFNLLLQILEDGILTDASGLEVNFKNTIIILTSNIDVSDITLSRKLGFKENDNLELTDRDQKESILMDKLSDKIKPEILNRLDHLVVFNALKKKDLEKITELELEKLKNRLEKQNLKITFSKKIFSFIAEKSFNDKFGARLIRRNIQKLIEEKIAKLIMQDAFRNNALNISVKNNEIILK
ncbi:MAG: ATP-dependent Clp protease ATP-binding subunit [Candidatus Moraniibacteriota bacterium]